MRHQAGDILACLGFDLSTHRLVFRIGRTGKEEILPHEETERVAGLVERLRLVNAAAPDAQQIDIGIARLRNPRGVTLRRHAGQEAIVGNPVRAAHEDRDVVDNDRESGAVFVGRGVEADGAEACLACPAVEDFACLVGKYDVEVVQRLVAESVRPPKFRVLDVESENRVVYAWRNGNG